MHNELVEFIREETGDQFHIVVAAYLECHPQSRNPIDDLDNPDAYIRFIDDCEKKIGVGIPIV